MYANVDDDDDDGAEIYRQNAAPHFTRAILYKNFTIRATLSRNLQEKCCAPESAQNADTHFVRACAVEMHVSISQQPLYTEMFRKNADAQSEHPDQTPAFTPTVRTPQCEHTVWGTKRKPRLTLRNQKPGNQEITTPGN